MTGLRRFAPTIPVQALLLGPDNGHWYALGELVNALTSEAVLTAGLDDATAVTNGTRDLRLLITTACPRVFNDSGITAMLDHVSEFFAGLLMQGFDGVVAVAEEAPEDGFGNWPTVLQAYSRDCPGRVHFLAATDPAGRLRELLPVGLFADPVPEPEVA